MPWKRARIEKLDDLRWAPVKKTTEKVGNRK
jgi:hypothetical protein